MALFSGDPMRLNCLAIWIPGPFEWILIGASAILLFHRRIPGLGRHLSGFYGEFRRELAEKPSTNTQPGPDVFTPNSLDKQ